MLGLKAGLASAAAVLTLAVAPALAQGAEPYWTSNGKIIKEGQLETVKSSASLTFHLAGIGLVTCKLTDEETIENPVGGAAGIDHLNVFSLTACKGKIPTCPPAVTAIVTGVPTATELLNGSPIRDEIPGLEIEFKCGVTLIERYNTGTLTPEVGASVLNFGAGSGELENSSSGKTMTITGSDKLTGPTGDTKIGAEEVEHEPHWYSDGKRIAEGTPEPVATSGTLTIHTTSANAVSVTCPWTDEEVVENPVGGGAGTDEVTRFATKGCKILPKCPAGTKLVVAAEPGSLSWPSELIAGTPITDEISGIAIEVKCEGLGGFAITYSGSLAPEVAANGALVFTAPSGTLLGSNSTTATLSGSDKLKGPTGDTKVTALDP